MATLRVAISIPAQRCEALYAGHARFIQARAEGGLMVQFPGNVMREYVTHDGIFGTFDLHFTADNRLTAVKRVSALRGGRQGS